MFAFMYCLPIEIVHWSLQYTWYSTNENIIGAARYRLNSERFPIPSAIGINTPAIAKMGRRHSMVVPTDLKFIIFKLYASPSA